MTRPGPTHCAECGVPIVQHATGQIRWYCCTPHRSAAYGRRRRKYPPNTGPCRQCGGELPPPTPTGGTPRTYCSRSCQQRAQRALLSQSRHIRTICEHCGEPMTPGLVTKRFCDRRCRNAALRERRRQKTIRAAGPCRECGGAMPDNRNSGAPRIYCSTQCCRRAQRKRAQCRNSALREAKRRTTCEYCDAPMKPETATRRFCSRPCKDRAWREVKRRPPPPSPREALVLVVGWPGAGRLVTWPDSAEVAA